jgi:NAD(P)-dependent dehydrogenase (short-subunit alcohol dehydrogenase family)
VASAGKAAEVVRDLQSAGVRAAAFKADQADAGPVAGLVTAVAELFGRFDILVNNAGVSAGGAVDNPASDLAFSIGSMPSTAHRVGCGHSLRPPRSWRKAAGSSQSSRALRRGPVFPDWPTIPPPRPQW